MKSDDMRKLLFALLLIFSLPTAIAEKKGFPTPAFESLCEERLDPKDFVRIPLPGWSEELSLYTKGSAYEPAFEKRDGSYLTFDYGYRLLEAIHVASIEPKKILVLGTGNGWDSVWLAKRFPQAQLLATDISADALTLAKINCRLNGVADRVDFKVADLYQGISGQFDLIVFNSPRALYRHESLLWLQHKFEVWGFAPVTAKSKARKSLLAMFSAAMTRPDLFDAGGRLFARLLRQSADRLSAEGSLFVMNNKIIPPKKVPATLTERRVSPAYDWGSLKELSGDEVDVDDAFAIHRFQKSP